MLKVLTRDCNQPRESMESPESDDVFSESWQNCALVGPVKKLNDMQIGFPRENLMLFPKNTAFHETNIISSIKNENLQSDLVLRKERVPVVKTENDINVGRLNDYSSEEDDYFIEESQNEVKFSPKGYFKTKPTITDSEGEESLSTIKNSKCNEKAIKEEYFLESKLIIQEELYIKDEAEDQCTAKSAVDQIKKWHHPRDKTTPLSGFIRINTNNRGLHPAEPPVFKCFNCTYQTNRRKYIAKHVLIHMRKTLKCSHCSYKANNKGALRQHKLIHVPTNQAKLHQCPECSYISTQKYILTQHMIKHQKADEGIWYQCPECPHKNKRQYGLTSHMLVHKKDAPMHKCTLCCYETFRKDDLMKHMRNIHIPIVIQPFHCQEEGCSFKTHHKSYLAKHIRVVHESKKFVSCSKCSYKAKYASDIKAHEVRHDEQGKLFLCTLCPYQTVIKRNLKKHMVVHKSSSEIKWFHCSECSFKSKYSSSLRLHTRIHNLNPGKVFKCSECSYKSVRANNLQAHQLVHKVSEWFYCYLCTYRTPRRRYLAKHIRKMHRGSDGRINDS